jgi:hypothetical protein
LDDLDPWLSLGASLLAMTFLPFWLGSMHVNVGILAVFCLLAGASLTIAEGWNDFTSGVVGSEGLIEDIALRTISVLVPATISFVAAARLNLIML